MRFRYGFANAVSEDEAKELYETFAVPASGGPIFQAASANLNPWTEAKVNSKYPDRGPLLIISGENDHTVPWAIANASFKKQKRNEAVTEIVEIPNRGPRTHSRQRLARGRGNGTGLRPAVRSYGRARPQAGGWRERERSEQRLGNGGARAGRYARRKGVALRETQLEKRPALRAFSYSPGWTRTSNPPVNSRMLCQLSYRGTAVAV
jgi:hypothetical protein